jgi:hypothetical protein
LAAIGGNWQGCEARAGAGPPKPDSNLAKSSKIQPSPAKEIKEKGFDFLGFSCPNRAFSKPYADPSRVFFCSPFRPRRALPDARPYRRP